MAYKPPRARCTGCGKWLFEHDNNGRATRVRTGVKLRETRTSTAETDPFLIDEILGYYAGRGSDAAQVAAWPSTEAPPERTRPMPPATGAIVVCTCGKHWRVLYKGV